MTQKIPPLASKQLEPLLVSIEDIRPHPDNYKTHPPEQLRSLKASLKTFSWTTPIKANLEGFIIAGHGMYQAALEEGYTHVPVEYCALDKQLSKAYLIADNETARKGVTEQDKLNELLEGALSIPDFDIEAVGFSSEDIDSLLNSGEPVEVVEDNFNPDEEVETRCKEGDLWELGKHRLLCGDSTIKENVERLMGGVKADMVFTDPPYGIEWNTDYTRFTGGQLPSIKFDQIKNDEKDFDPSYWIDNFNKCLFFGANCFSYKLPKGNWIVWDKRFENGEAFLADAEVAWYNGSGAVYIISETNQGFVSSDKKRYHPTQKPIKLIEKCFEQIKAPDRILDPYAGSGSTLITCEQTGRTCFCSEISPKYCDVIISRWEQFTNQTAKKLN